MAIAAEPAVASVEAASAVIHRHQYRHREIQTRRDPFEVLSTRVTELAEQQPERHEQIHRAFQGVTDARNTVARAWDAKDAELNHSYGAQVYFRDADALHAVITEQTTLLSTADVGTSVDSVAALVKKHHDDVKSVHVKRDKCAALAATAQALDTEHVTTRQKELQRAVDTLVALSDDRATRLAHAAEYHKYLRDVDEVSEWIAEKRTLAQEPPYRDVTNLPRKLQRHVAFSSEVHANANRVDLVVADGARLVAEAVHDTASVTAAADGVQAAWHALVDECADLKGKLEDVIAQVAFNRNADELLAWISMVETTLQTATALGTDLPAARLLLKQHENLCADVQAHRRVVEELAATATALIDANNFRASDIARKQEGITAEVFATRVGVPAQARLEALQASVQLQTFYRGVAMETAWARQTQAVVGNTDVGADLMGTKLLLSAHYKTVLEVQGRQARFDALVATATDLTTATPPHYAAADIVAARDALRTLQDELQQHVRVRSDHLRAALCGHEVMATVRTVGAWLEDKLAAMRDTDVGDDADLNAERVQRHTLETEAVEAYADVVHKLGADCTAACAMPTADVAALTGAWQDIEATYNTLVRAGAWRGAQLADAHAYYGYAAEVREHVFVLDDWTREVGALTAAGDTESTERQVGMRCAPVNTWETLVFITGTLHSGFSLYGSPLKSPTQNLCPYLHLSTHAHILTPAPTCTRTPTDITHFP